MTFGCLTSQNDKLESVKLLLKAVLVHKCSRVMCEEPAAWRYGAKCLKYLKIIDWKSLPSLSLLRWNKLSKEKWEFQNRLEQ